MIITLSGRPGSGKSSVGRALAKKLGYKFYSAGDARRACAREKNLTLAELNKQAEKDPSSDFLVDDYMKQMAEKEDDFVIDAWLGFFFFPQSIKIFFDAEPKIRAKRIYERADFEEHSENLKQALQMMQTKEECSLERYRKLYGLDNAFDPNHFDLVVDTTNTTVEQIAGIVYRFVMHKMNKA